MVGVGAFLQGCAVEDGGLATTVPIEWRQGRTCSGGLSAALAFTAAQGVAGDLPPLRTATFVFISPLVGAIRARASLARRGRSTAFVDAEISGSSGVGLKAGFVFISERDSAIRRDDTRPPVATEPESSAPAFTHGGPDFASNLDYRHAWPELRPEMPDRLLWVRLRERDAGRFRLAPAAELLLVADALPPAAEILHGERRLSSTITWMINLLTANPTTIDGWWLLRSHTQHTAQGFSSQQMAMWNRDGICVAQGLQSVAVF